VSEVVGIVLAAGQSTRMGQPKALLPVAVLSPFVQRHFRKGMLTGAVKG